jgi:pentatricopeptide repeat protein
MESHSSQATSEKKFLLQSPKENNYKRLPGKTHQHGDQQNSGNQGDKKAYLHQSTQHKQKSNQKYATPSPATADASESMSVSVSAIPVEDNAPVDEEQRERERRFKIIQLNNGIAAHASKKELSEAVAIFENAKKENLINSHTYAATLNAYVRCGDMIGARALFDEIKASNRFKLDVISFTTMMKGYCADGHIDHATELLRIMPISKPPVVPNIRTINTFLRGCIITGSVALAVDAFDQMKSVHKLAPDVSTYESIVALLCQGLQLEKAMPIVGRLKDDESVKNGLSIMYFQIGRAAAMMADWKLMRRSFASAQEYLNHINDGTATAGGASDEATPSSTSKVTVGGGKRSWKATMDESRLESLQMFREHKRQELCNEIENISKFGESCASRGLNVPKVKPFYRLLSFGTETFAKLKSLLVDRTSEGDAAGDDEVSVGALVTDELLENLCEKFGVLAVLAKLFPSLMNKPLSQLLPKSALSQEASSQAKKKKFKSKDKKDKEKEKEKSKKEEIVVPPGYIETIRELPILQHLRQHLQQSVDSEGFIVFEKLFQQYEDVTPSVAATATSLSSSSSSSALESVKDGNKKPVYVEICSGAGEWVVAQVSSCLTRYLILKLG